MLTCFVIQPFDAGKFDKRFDDIYKPAIESAGLEAYRVDRDPKVEIPIEAIETGIRSAAICLADITTENPNVWYELGFAYASGRPVVMVCSDERTSKKYPFDIQHRTIVTYSTEAPRDFALLKTAIVERIGALLTKTETLRQVVETEQVAPMHGLSQSEILVLATIAGDSAFPSSSTSLYSLKSDAERAGLTSIGFSLALRRLIAKSLVEVIEEHDDRGEGYSAARLMDRGWEWIEMNETLFVLRKSKPSKFDDFEDNTPF